MQRTLERGDHRLGYDDVGRGEPVLLFLHGWANDRTVFTPVVERLAARTRCLALDWRGHGESSAGAGDFTGEDLVDDARALLDHVGAARVVVVSSSHAGFPALELRRRLGERVAGLCLVDWIIGDPPPPFVATLAAIQDADALPQARERLFALWRAGLDLPDLERQLAQMARHDAAMWARAGREISAAYAREGTPLQALARLDPPVPAVHLYGQPEDPGYLAMQRDYAAAHPWFSVERLPGRTHFPTLEIPDAVAAAIGRFLDRVA